MKFRPLACGFHSHTDVGSLDGGSTTSSKIIRAAELGRIADCVTDHGTMNAIGPHYFESKKLHKGGKISHEIKSIHGIEVYLIDEIRGPKVTNKNGDLQHRYVHLTIHFRTLRAYQYFCSLTPKMEQRAITIVGERKPLVYLSELQEIAGEITIGTGCLVGYVMKNINDFSMSKSDRYQTAAMCYEQLRGIAGPDNFFVEVFPHVVAENWKRPQFAKDKKSIIKEGYFEPILEKNHVCSHHCAGVEHIVDECGHQTIAVDLQKTANLFVIEQAQKFKDRIVISEDNHFAYPEDYLVQSVRLGNGAERWKFKNSYHMADTNEWANCLKTQLNVTDRDIEEWIDNSYYFVDRFSDYKFETSKDRFLLPDMEMVYGVSEKTTREKFWELAKKHDKLPKPENPKYQQYMDRIETELSVLCENSVADFLPYFFVLEDCAEYARKSRITFTCRGSAGGSLVLYALNVSIIDPIKYGLQFERFLTLGRIASGSLPDVDTDWQGRLIILDYLRSKYGDRVALISTNMLMRLKSSIKDVERSILGHVRSETERMCKGIPGASQGQSDKDWLFGAIDKSTGEKQPGFIDNKEDEFSVALKKYSIENKEIWKSVLRCIGITKNKGVHAGGVIIAPEPIHKYFPLIRTEQGMATAWDMKAVEDAGGVKFDFLALETLDAIGIAIQSIYERTGIDIEWDEFPHDPEVYTEIVAKNKLAAIFQINTPTVLPYVLRIKPDSVAMIAATTALVRPGSLDAPSPDPSDPYTGSKTGSDANIHAAEYFVRCREGRKKPYYIHPDLEPILNETYGVIVYQEQALRIFRDLAGYTFADAEDVRRAIGKKIKELLELHLGILKKEVMARGWTDAQASKLCESLIASANYSFNKSHSVAYAIVAYNGCWLKRHYPMDFWKGELTVASHKHDKLKKYLSECEVPILPVDVLRSHPSDWVVEGSALRPPLSMIKGCGEGAAEKIKKFIDSSVDEYVGGIVSGME